MSRKRKRDQPTIDESLQIVREGNWDGPDGDLCAHAFNLMNHCESDSRITCEDGLSLLDHGGVIAEIGARILYLLTGRDGLGWSIPESGEYVTDKKNWIAYLSSQN